jgi:hypothetical protein
MKREHKKARDSANDKPVVQEYNKQRDQLLRLAHDLSQTLNLNEVLQKIAKAAKELLHAHAIAIYLPSIDGKELHPVAAIDPTI